MRKDISKVFKDFAYNRNKELTRNGEASLKREGWSDGGGGKVARPAAN